jgi:hypothetical protein
MNHQPSSKHVRSGHISLGWLGNMLPNAAAAFLRPQKSLSLSLRTEKFFFRTTEKGFDTAESCCRYNYKSPTHTCVKSSGPCLSPARHDQAHLHGAQPESGSAAPASNAQSLKTSVQRLGGHEGEPSLGIATGKLKTESSFLIIHKGS